MSELNSTAATFYSGAEVAIIGMAGRFPGAKDVNEFPGGSFLRRIRMLTT